ncbi:MAG: sugar ABC transporter ATP-binding protein [Bryobacterales bacterium]|nr:sugar ABC transporter ATP-binding protein [Bryobacterales bacterium]
MLLELSSIRKSFGGVRALRDGNLSVAPGQVHALVGENGAGKSTLMKIVAGMLRRDGGDMLWKGRVVDFARPAEAHALGIHMVHQESLLAPHLTVSENVFLGRETRRGALLDRVGMERATARILESHHFPLQANWTVEKLSPAQKQIVEICRALHGEPSMLIFDEPTSSLSDTEAAEVFRTVRELRDRGIGIVYITHRLGELDEIADDVTVLRDGETVHSCPADEVSTREIVHHMVGRDVAAIYDRDKLAPGEVRLKVDVPGVALEVRAGEIVGIAGLMGAGRTEVCETIFGITPAKEGSIAVNGVERNIQSPHGAVEVGIALVTEDRQRTGLAIKLPVRTNVTLANMEAVCTGGVVQAGKERRVAEDYQTRLRMQVDNVEQSAWQLSGGNQQKVVIAKWLFRDTDIVLFDEPTRGIDVGAKAEVFALMDEMAREGKAIVMVSSELPELLQVADRILVMREGSVVAELPRETTQQEIMHHAAVGH